MSESSKIPSSVATLKNMRKGTRSCCECRHRKIRCVPRPNNTATCISCFSHGIRCVSQAESEPVPPPQGRMNLSERVAQLEQELASMRANGEGLTFNTKEPSAGAMKHINGVAGPTVSLRTSSSEISFPLSALPTDNFPVLSLFDNAVLASNRRQGLNDSIYREFSMGSLRPASFESSPHFRKSRIKRAKACEALTDLLPSHTAMYEILEIGGFGWDATRKMHPYLCCEDDKTTIQSYVFFALNQDNPAVIGCALSWMALSLQCLPHDFESNHLGLPLPVDDLTEHYISSIDRLIVSDDELSVSLEGIECIVLQAQFYSNVGRPRKAWTTIRRGLSHAVLLGLHRISPQVSSDSSLHAKRRETVWWHLIECDSYLSLLLGLPSFFVPAFLDLEKRNVGSTGNVSNEFYRRNLAVIVGTISQRNQAIPTSLSSLLSATIQIDHELENLASLLPSFSWDFVALSDQGLIRTLEIHERLTMHFWYQLAKAYLHLPFMLQPPSDNQYDYNRTQCLIASREMVQVYVRLREISGGKFNLCRVVDFQAFTAAVILILGLLGYRPTTVPQNPSQEEKDWSLVYTTMDFLRKASSEPENLTAAQCLRGLETLVLIGHGQFSAEENSQECKIFIPYFGMISMAPRSKYTTVKTNLPECSTHDAIPHMEKAETPPTGKPQAQNPCIEIDVFNAPFLGNIVQNMPSFAQPSGPDGMSLHDTLAMDIDQDWSWMLNSNYQMA